MSLDIVFTNARNCALIKLQHSNWVGTLTRKLMKQSLLKGHDVTVKTLHFISDVVIVTYYRET